MTAFNLKIVRSNSYEKRPSHVEKGTCFITQNKSVQNTHLCGFDSQIARLLEILLA